MVFLSGHSGQANRCKCVLIIRIELFGVVAMGKHTITYRSSHGCKSLRCIVCLLEMDSIS